VWDATRTAIDIDLDAPVLLGVVVSVHHCRKCQRYFRAQPPFLRPDAIYTQRVVAKAIAAVYQDGLAFRRVAERLARDFWVRPSEAIIRRWCQAYAESWDFERDYLPWVVETFSGVLCVDEVYQRQLALLLAVDPAGADGDRLVGYQLVQGSVDQATMDGFLRRLRVAGIQPAQVITDGAALYPSLLAEVWPAAAQQLCLFHESRRVTTAVNDVLKTVRRQVPTPPPATRATLGGRPRRITPPTEATDHSTERWRWREASRAAVLARVHQLRSRGLSLREITRQTGLNRRTVTKWLRYETPAELVASPAIPPVPVHLSESPPPAPWTSWAQVRQVREQLKVRRSLLLRRPDHLSADEQAQLQALLDSTGGTELPLARAFLVEWYAIWRDEAGQRRPLMEACARYERWRANPNYRRLAPLRRVQESIDPARFDRLSCFLREPTWQATNNGAERMGRTFRHRQRPHFNLRTPRSIAADLTVGACLRKQTASSPVVLFDNRCRRGNRPLVQPAAPAA
jgi:transposase-like protein